MSIQRMDDVVTLLSKGEVVAEGRKGVITVRREKRKSWEVFIADTSGLLSVFDKEDLTIQTQKGYGGIVLFKELSDKRGALLMGSGPLEGLD